MVPVGTMGPFLLEDNYGSVQTMDPFLPGDNSFKAVKESVDYV